MAGLSLCQDYLDAGARRQHRLPPGDRGGRRARRSRSPTARRRPSRRSSARRATTSTSRTSPSDVRRVLGPDLALYHRTFHPDLPGLGVIGQFLALGPYFPLLELQARWIVAVWSGEVALPDAPAMRQHDRPAAAAAGRPQRARAHALRGARRRARAAGLGRAVRAAHVRPAAAAPLPPLRPGRAAAGARALHRAARRLAARARRPRRHRGAARLGRPEPRPALGASEAAARSQRCAFSAATCSSGRPAPSPTAPLRSTLRTVRMPGITVETAGLAEARSAARPRAAARASIAEVVERSRARARRRCSSGARRGSTRCGSRPPGTSVSGVIAAGQPALVERDAHDHADVVRSQAASSSSSGAWSKTL